MWRWFVFVVPLLTGCGCKPPSVYEINFVDPSFFPVLVTAVDDAAADWSAKTGATITLKFRQGNCGQAGVICMHQHDPWPPDSLGEGVQTAGLTVMRSNGDGADVWLDASMTGDELKSITRHELGHAMGLDHVLDEGEIMFRVPKVTTVQPGDVQQWRDIR